MKRLILLAFLAVSLAACGNVGDTSANRAESLQQQRDSQELVRNQPIPATGYSQYRQNLIEIEQAEQQGIQSTSFMMGSAMDLDPVDICPSIGMPIPVTASLSNPHQLAAQWMGGSPSDTYSKYVDGVIDQMDPNGVYTGGSGEGTYVMCIDATGKASVHYNEGIVNAVFGPAVWDYTHHRIQTTGPSAFHFSTGQGK